MEISEKVRNKIVIVTGASSGIGEGITYQLASCGFKLSLTGRNRENLEKVVENCVSKGLPKEKVIYTLGDLTDSDFRKTLIEATVTAFGGIDVLVNNAGTGHVSSFTDTPEDIYRRIVEINQTTPFFLSQLAIPYLKKSKGCIVNISSIISTARPVPGTSAYGMSKAGIDVLTKYLAMELAPFGIRANSISPGYIKTKLADTAVPDEKEREDMMYYWSYTSGAVVRLEHQTGVATTGKVGRTCKELMDSNIPSSPAYGVFISQLMGYARASTHYSNFVLRAKRLAGKLLSQGYVSDRLILSLRKLYGRYEEYIVQYDISLSRMVDDVLV